MKFIFDTKYSETELEFLSRHNCKMISEIKLSKMDLSEHDFYMFRNSESNGISIVYRRKNGGYGLIESE